MKHLKPLALVVLTAFIATELLASGFSGGGGGGDADSITNGADKLISITSSGVLETQLNTTSVVREYMYEFSTNSTTPVEIFRYTLPASSFVTVEYWMHSRDATTEAGTAYLIYATAYRGAAGGVAGVSAGVISTIVGTLHSVPFAGDGNDIVITAANNSGTNVTYGVMWIRLREVKNNT